MDRGNSTALLLPDLSSAFDTVNHTILLNMLSSLGVKGEAHKWFESYLSYHSQIVCINGCKSVALPLSCGVPQGSVGGPTVFSIYLIGLRQVLLQHGIDYHIYADDIQLMISFNSDQAAAERAVHRLESCMADAHDWMLARSLKLNLDKCKFLIFGSKVQLSKVNINCISFSCHIIHLSQTCRNLGVMFDSHMTMSDQVSNICRSVRYQLRNIGFIRKYLSKSATEKLVHALISSRLDFGNALLINLLQTPEASKRCSSYCFSDHQAYPHFPSFAVATLAPSKRSHCFQNVVAYLSLRSRLCSSIPYLSNPKLHSRKTSTLIHFQFSCDPQNYQNVGGKIICIL